MATHQIAQGIAQLGRHGDSTLVHMQPHEVAGLQAIAKSQGTSLTINPETGLPEAFSLGGFFKSLLPTIAGFGAAAMSGGTMSPMVAGILAGSATGALTNKNDPLMGAVMGGLGGYGGQSLYGAAMAPTAAAAKSTEAMIKNAGVDPSLIYSGSAVKPSAGIDFSNAVGTPNYNIAPLNTTGAGVQLNKGALPGFATDSSLSFNPSVAPGGTMGTKFINPNAGFGSSAATGIDNISQAVGNITNDPLKFAMDNKMAVGMPLAGAALGGLEPSDLYGNPMQPSDKDKYDPYKTLNLNTNTGLKLYAQGGPVSFADGGDALKGGGSGAMEGAGLGSLDVSDIDARYNLSNPSAAQPWGGSGTWGSYNTWNANSGMPSIEPPKLGLFASNDQIEAARTAYEQQLAAAMSGRGGMGSFPGADALNAGMGRISGGPMAGSMGAISGGPAATIAGNAMGSTAPTASTAQTALSRLNLNKKYAEGGTIQSGGLQDLYGTSDNVTGPALSQDGYGLGRLQAMANGGVASYAEGGETKVMPHFGARYLPPKIGNALDPVPVSSANVSTNRFNDFMNDMNARRTPAGAAPLPMGFEMYNRMIENGLPDRNALSLGSPALQGGNLNLNTPSGLGMAKGGYLDGPGDGMSDSIPATIEGRQPARLADGEFVVPADVVSHLGNGSTKAGSQRLYGMLDKVRKARTGTKKQGKQIKAEKYLPA